MREIHVFRRLGALLAYEPERMNLFGVNGLTAAIFRAAGGRSVQWLLDHLAPEYNALEVQEVLEQLVRLNLAARVPMEHYSVGMAPAPSPVAVSHESLPAIQRLTRLVLFITQECNLRCYYCFVRAKGEMREKHMSMETACAAVNLLFAESGQERDLSISFYGGEPLLRLDLLRELVPWIQSRGRELNKNVSFTLTTNGVLLTDEALAFLRDNHIAAAISLDGDRETHDHNRVFADGGGSFQQVFSGWKKLREQDKKTGVVAVSRDFSRPLAEVGQFLLEAGVGSIIINPALNSAGEFIMELPEGSGEDAVELFGQELEAMAAAFLESGALSGEVMPLAFLGIIKWLETKEKPPAGCGAASKRIAVDADGNILPCDAFLGEKDFYMGHVVTGPDFRLREVFNVQPLLERETCRTCWGRNFCNGGCPGFSFKRHGDLNTPVEQQCRLLKAQFEIAMAVYSQLKKIRKEHRFPAEGAGSGGAT